MKSLLSNKLASSHQITRLRAAWIRGLAGALKKGAILLMDYSLPRRQFYSPDRSDGTLLCHFRHQFHNDPFRYVGLQDIGAWVDFTTVAESAVDAGLTVDAHTLPKVQMRNRDGFIPRFPERMPGK